MRENKEAWEDLYSKGDSYLKYPNEALIITYHRIKKILPEHITCLDYGFGSGNNSEFIIGNVDEFYGLEISEQAKEITSVRLEKYKNFSLENLIISHNEFISEFQNKFDLIVAWHVLSYNDDAHIEKAISHLYQYLKEDGILITTLATKRDITYHNSLIMGQNTYEINHNIPNQEGCLVVIPQSSDEFKKYFNKFKVLDIGHEERISYMSDDYHSHYYGVFQK